ncbi:10600_t:CDS:2 [Acaulospora morrowiae]|uniref:10600_t:CDS:1 n=1 Tax=Acaulospora morrowiae TaxID=94023 RepID=A0A9N8W0L1_9GLOM|nr:10600_t:CDS:2 [Acaulospora morrowiae]
MQDLNNSPLLQIDFRQDICSIPGVSPISILHHTSPYHSHHKEVDVAPEYLNISFTEYLTDPSDRYLENYNFVSPHEAICPSPESDSYSMFNMDDSKIKMEYPEQLDQSCPIYMTRNISQESCPELSVCNPSSISTSPLTPIDSPIIEILMNNDVNDQCNRGRSRGRMTSSPLPEMIQDPQEFHHSIMGSMPPHPPQQKPIAKSRGRRVTNKPTKPGTKSFECSYPECGRVFKRSEHLKRHIRSIHTLERPFHCPHPHCTKRFSRSDNLSQHVRVHRPNGKEKNATARAFSNFTPYLQTYQTGGNVHPTLPPN